MKKLLLFFVLLYISGISSFAQDTIVAKGVDDQKAEKSYNEGITLFDRKEYSNALTKFDEAIAQFVLVLNENGEHPMCNFYMGLCYMEKNNFKQAINSFQKVIIEKDNLFIEQAEWYMALSMLKTNEVKESYTILNRIVDNKEYYQKNAKELLNKLK